MLGYRMGLSVSAHRRTVDMVRWRRQSVTQLVQHLMQSVEELIEILFTEHST